MQSVRVCMYLYDDLGHHSTQLCAVMRGPCVVCFAPTELCGCDVFVGSQAPQCIGCVCVLEHAERTGTECRAICGAQ